MMYDCPKFESCSAPICPLDPDWKTRTMLPGEKVCFYLRELARNTDLRCAVPREMLLTLAEVYPQVYHHCYATRRGLLRAAVAGSKLKGGQRLND